MGWYSLGGLLLSGKGYSAHHVAEFPMGTIYIQTNKKYLHIKNNQ